MRIVYINIGGSLKVTSVYKKIQGQVNAFNSLDTNCKGYFLSTSVKQQEPFSQNIDFYPVKKAYQKYFSQLQQKKNFLAALKNILSDETFDFVYLRFSFNHPRLLSILKKYPKKVIIEMNSKSGSEIKSQFKNSSHSSVFSKLFSKIQDYYIPILHRKLYAKRIKKAALLIVCVTHELTAYYANEANKIKTITNGISTQKYPIRTPQTQQKVTILILDGTSVNASWHGTDRLIKSIKKHQLEAKIDVRIAGNITSKINESFVKQLGFLEHDQLEAEFNRADFGTGNLCLFKKGLKEASVLKNREYLTRGLPILYAFDDFDIDQTPFKNFCFKIPNDDSIIDLPEIVSWIRSLQKNKPNHPQEMNILAKEILDFSIKLPPLITYLKEEC